MIITDLKITPTLNGAQISFLTKDKVAVDNLIGVAGKSPLQAKIQPCRGKRSTDANAYLWVLCDKIAEVIHSTKEEVYRRAIREVGVYSDVAVQNTALSTLIEDWTSRGIGWMAETFDSKLEGCKRVRLYKGSHLYNTKQMSRLIDYIVQEANDLSIETLTDKELNVMLNNC